MKITITWFLFFCIILTTGKAQTITALVSGNWTTASIWSLNRLPQAGDTVIIPTGRLVTITTNINNSTARFVILISGTLRFDGGGAKLAMHSSSSIVVFP